MGKQEKAAKKLAKQKQKARTKRQKKIENGMNLCLIAACFLVTVVAAAMDRLDARKRNGNSAAMHAKSVI